MTKRRISHVNGLDFTADHWILTGGQNDFGNMWLHEIKSLAEVTIFVEFSLALWMLLEDRGWRVLVISRLGKWTQPDLTKAWLVCYDFCPKMKPKATEREPSCLDVGTRFCIHEKHRNSTNAFSSFIFDFVAFSSLFHPEPIKIPCSPKATANQHSMAEVSSTFATRWEKHRSLWIANELDSATLGVFWVDGGAGRWKGQEVAFFSRKLGDFWVILLLSARKSEIVETEQIDQLFMWVMLVVACLYTIFICGVFLRLLTLNSW